MTAGALIGFITEKENQLQQRVADLIAACDIHQANPLWIATEATGFYDWHLLEYLTQSPEPNVVFISYIPFGLNYPKAKFNAA